MIITKMDVANFESELDRIVRRRMRDRELGAYFEGHEEEFELNRLLSNQPHILMAGADLQEFVGAHELSVYQELVDRRVLVGMKRPAFRKFNGQWLVTSCLDPPMVHGYSIAAARKALQEVAQVRKRTSAEDDDDDSLDEALQKCRVDIGDLEAVTRKAKKLADRDDLDPTVFVNPQLWTPESQRREKKIIQTSALPLIRALRQETKTLSELHWRELEDVVTEILRASGMEVHKARATPQGGRDIFARTQIAPGEVLTIAVEVKQKALVDRPEIHAALHQNAHFPALMIVTSGRFSAGVIREARHPENRMRLFLKDGVAISELIQGYALSK